MPTPTNIDAVFIIFFTLLIISNNYGWIYLEYQIINLELWIQLFED